MNNYSILHKSTGILRYKREGEDYKLIVEVDQGISDLYRKLIPKWITAHRQGWGAHITVVRSGKEFPLNKEAWGKYDYELIDFIYSPYIHNDYQYFWLNVFCTRLEDIRQELGLPITSRWTLPPDGYSKTFHITIANCKEV